MGYYTSFVRVFARANDTIVSSTLYLCYTPEMLTKVRKLFDPAQRILRNAEKRLPEITEKLKEYDSKPNSELTRIIAKHKEELKVLAEKISFEEKSSIRLRKKTDTLSKIEIEIYQKLQALLPEVYAILDIATKRKVGMSRFDVQFLAGSILATGQKLVEMKTGEGKTITFQLPLFLYGLTGRGAHLVTVNDYLAKRDGEYAGHIFGELGITVGIITPQAAYKFIPDSELAEKKGPDAAKERAAHGEAIKISNLNGTNLLECSKMDAYACDVVYGTNNEFGFDYLRDNMARTYSSRVQRELYFCIVDEADSILIDEARTPLIISAPAADSNNLYASFAQLVKLLKEEDDFVIEHKERAVNLTDAGIAKMEKLLGVKNIWEDYRLAHHMENALKAQVFYDREKQYMVRAGEVVIVDEFTGRVLPGRRYSEGLHQAIEAKEGVAIQQESKTLASITFQNFFRIYKILCGGSGTILTEQEEFFKIYNLECCDIPTNKNMVRKDESDRIYRNKEAKFNAVVSEIIETSKTGQPILVGTTSISDSEYLSNQLTKEDIRHEVLNAKYHEREAQIVAKAGAIGAVTVATNMAGRGTDIPLGDGAREVGGLYVIGTERHEARRIDNQLRGRSGRQGDPGMSRFYVGLDDQIMKMQGGETIQRIMAATNFPVDLPIESKLVSRSIERAQKRMEGMYFDSRKHVVEYDDVINQQREIFYSRRLRYLTLADELAEALASEKKSDEDKNKLQKLEDQLQSEFDEAITGKARSISENYSVFTEHEGKTTTEANSEIAKLIMSVAADNSLMIAANYLKLFKEDIKTSAQLEEVITRHLTEDKGDQEKIFSFTEKLLQTAINLKLKEISNLGSLVHVIFIEVMDELWTTHLEFMQDIREGIGLRGIAQLDPLVEYKNEGFKAFTGFISRLSDRALNLFLQISEVRIQPAQEIPAAQISTNAAEIENLLTGTREIGAEKPQRVEVITKEDNKSAKRKELGVPEKWGRNDECFCGSGKKYKKCCLGLSPEEQAAKIKKYGGIKKGVIA